MPWRDYRDLMRLMEHDMHRFTEDALRAFLDSPGAIHRFWLPAADIHETERGIVIKMELAGVTTETVNVSLAGDGRRLVVSGTRGEPDEERGARTGCHQLEIYFGPFERTFDLPDDLEIDRDGITATLRNGFLTILLPLLERENVPVRHIPIDME